MKPALFSFTALLFFAASVFIALEYEAVVYFFVLKLGLGWVYSSIFIRIIVAFLFIIGLNSIFKIFKRTRTVKKWIVVLIGIVPGFFISFGISPIYDIDYGMLDDKLKLETFAELPNDTNDTYVHSGGSELIAFLDVGCEHCKMALKKLNANVAAGQVIPIHLFFHNDSSDVLNFMGNNNEESITLHYLQNEGQFIEHAGFEFPSIFLMNPQSETNYHWVGDEMNYSALDYLLSLEQ
ncbi:MAG: hypothetical protein ACI8ZM_004090 [Crocinitomix sp.]|jgi:hypothetical protein